MYSILAKLRENVTAAIKQAFGGAAGEVDPLVRAATDPQFGDYQSNVAMGLAKKLGMKPREVAQKIVDALRAAPPGTRFVDLCETPEIAGPGFINFRLKREFIEQSLASITSAPPAPPAPPDQPMWTPLPTGAGFDRVGIEPLPPSERQVVVIDYSSPNVAKQMHVGHLRSTIIGDTIARVLEFEGHQVIRQNHLGDWGTQMGIILVAFEQLRKEGRSRGRQTIREDEKVTLDRPTVDLRLVEERYKQLEERYKELNARMESDDQLRQEVQSKLQNLQAAKPDSIEYMDWWELCEYTIIQIEDIYRRLGVSLVVPQGVQRHIGALMSRSSAPEYREKAKHWIHVGESFYHGALPGIVAGLKEAAAQNQAKLVEVRGDQGATCIFLQNADGSPAFRGPGGAALPLIVRKSDGTYLYATTDLAAIWYRVGYLGARRIIYVVGTPQSLHFQMLFATVQAVGWAEGVRLEHVTFGSVLGEDRKMLRTRSGESVKLKDLLDEAVQRAEKLVRDTEADPEKRRGFTEAEIKHIADAVGISAVKYADLCQNRNSDYVFSWDKMLALQGNTAPYMLYAYARICSIYRKGAEAGEAVASDQPSTISHQPSARVEHRPADSGERSAIRTPHSALDLAHPAERALAVGILRLAETIDAVAATLLPNILCDYLYDLAGRFMTFYESCPVLQAPDAATRASRLRLCDLTARALQLGLGLLGIPTLERM